MNRRTALLTMAAGLTKPAIETDALYIVDILPVTRIKDAAEHPLHAGVVIELEMCGFDLRFSNGSTVRHTGAYTMSDDMWRMVSDWVDRRIKANTAAMIERGEVCDVTGGAE